jgi:hypothetical protein
VQSKPGQLTDVLVRGRPNPLQIAGTVGGLKLLEIRRLAARGHAIAMIGDGQFWKLVDGAAPSRRSGRDRRTTARGKERRAAAAPRSSKRSEAGSRQLLQ